MMPAMAGFGAAKRPANGNGQETLAADIDK
jgi:hypothetical protein